MSLQKSKSAEKQPTLKQTEKEKKTHKDSEEIEVDAEVDGAIEAFIRIALNQFRKLLKNSQYELDQ